LPVLLCDCAPMLIIALALQNIFGSLPVKAAALNDDLKMGICASI
jgi:hypothetical protein